jgi:RecG-like helicase
MAKEVLDVLSGNFSSRPMNRMLQGEVGSGKTIVSVLAMLQMIDATISVRCWRRRKFLPPNMPVHS